MGAPVGTGIVYIKRDRQGDIDQAIGEVESGSVDIRQKVHSGTSNFAGFLALDDALDAFSRLAPRQAQVVELRYFGGLTEEEIVEVLKISPRTVRRDWDVAKAWLSRELNR